MVPLPRERWSFFRDALPDRAGSLAGRHTIATGGDRAARAAAAARTRVCYALEGDARPSPAPAGVALRALDVRDAGALASLAPSLRWIADPWDGAEPLARSGFARGAFAGERLVLVAASYFVGERCEELGVVTEPEFRGRGLAAACATRLIRDVRARARRAGWSTSTDNLSSQRVAEKLGFREERETFLLVAGAPMPVLPRR